MQLCPSNVVQRSIPLLCFFAAVNAIIVQCFFAAVSTIIVAKSVRLSTRTSNMTQQKQCSLIDVQEQGKMGGEKRCKAAMIRISEGKEVSAPPHFLPHIRMRTRTNVQTCKQTHTYTYTHTLYPSLPLRLACRRVTHTHTHTHTLYPSLPLRLACRRVTHTHTHAVPFLAPQTGVQACHTHTHTHTLYPSLPLRLACRCVTPTHPRCYSLQ